MKSIDYKFEGLGIEVMIWTVKFLTQMCLSEGGLGRKTEIGHHISRKRTPLKIRLCEHLTDKDFNCRNPLKTIQSGKG